MGEVLREYASEVSSYAGVSFLWLSLVVIGIAFILVLVGGMLLVDEHGVGVVMIVVGIGLGVGFFTLSSDARTLDTSEIDNWFGEQEEYIEYYGEVKSEVKDGKFKIGSGEYIGRDAEDKIVEIDELIGGCDESVYAVTDEGDVWVCQ